MALDARLQLLRRQKKRPAQISSEVLDAFDRGEASLAEVLSLASDDVEHLRERGIAFFEAGFADKALAVFEMLVAVEGEDPATTLLLSWCHHELGHVETAQRLLASVLDPQGSATPALRAAALQWTEHTSDPSLPKHSGGTP